MGNSLQLLKLKTAFLLFCILIISANNKAFAQTNKWELFGLSDEGTIYQVAVSPGDSIFATSYGKVFRYSGSQSQWITADEGYTAAYLLLAKSDNIIFVGSYHSIKRSLDGGKTWAAATNGVANVAVRALALDSEGGIYTGGYNNTDGSKNGLFYSSNDGDSWTNIGLVGETILSITVKENGTIFVGTTHGVFRSADNGDNWDAVNTGLTYTSITDLLIDENDHVFASDLNNGVFISTNDGDNWTGINTGIGSKFIDCLAQKDGGITLAASSASSQGVYQTNNDGIQWNNYGLQDTSVYSLAVSSLNTVYAGTSFGVYRIDDVATNIEMPSGMINQFSLKQNYPNPFSDETIISWKSEIAGQTKIEVYNITGRRIKILTDSHRQPGQHQVAFNSAYLPSGIYYYQLTIGNYKISKKMVLLK